LVWFRDEINSDVREDHWHALTRLTLRDELDSLQQALTVSVSSVDEGETDVKILIDKWVNKNQRIVTRWERFLSMLHANDSVDYSMFFIAIRELNGLLQKNSVS
jgi:glutamate dehydrogenase